GRVQSPGGHADAALGKGKTRRSGNRERGNTGGTGPRRPRSPSAHHGRKRGRPNVRKRTFYIVNLDRNRILALGVLFVGFVLTASATGWRIGRTGENKPVADLSAPAGPDGRAPEAKERSGTEEPGASVYALPGADKNSDGRPSPDPRRLD